MRSYHVIWFDEKAGINRQTEFEASDPYGALQIAQFQLPGRTTEVWEEGRKLCTLRRIGPDGTVWEIGPGEAVGNTEVRRARQGPNAAGEGNLHPHKRLRSQQSTDHRMR